LGASPDDALGRICGLAHGVERLLTLGHSLVDSAAAGEQESG
jgi:hypothetical protein